MPNPTSRTKVIDATTHKLLLELEGGFGATLRVARGKHKVSEAAALLKISRQGLRKRINSYNDLCIKSGLSYVPFSIVEGRLSISENGTGFLKSVLWYQEQLHTSLGQAVQPDSNNELVLATTRMGIQRELLEPDVMAAWQKKHVDTSVWMLNPGRDSIIPLVRRGEVTFGITASPTNINELIGLNSEAFPGAKLVVAYTNHSDSFESLEALIDADYKLILPRHSDRAYNALSNYLSIMPEVAYVTSGYNEAALTAESYGNFFGKYAVVSWDYRVKSCKHLSVLPGLVLEQTEGLIIWLDKLVDFEQDFRDIFLLQVNAMYKGDQ